MHPCDIIKYNHYQVTTWHYQILTFCLQSYFVSEIKYYRQSSDLLGPPPALPRRIPVKDIPSCIHKPTPEQTLSETQGDRQLSPSFPVKCPRHTILALCEKVAYPRVHCHV
jgi:hypothetical protein